LKDFRLLPITDDSRKDSKKKHKCQILRKVVQISGGHIEATLKFLYFMKNQINNEQCVNLLLPLHRISLN